MTCHYCDAAPVQAVTVRVGVKPSNPKLINTKVDTRKLEVIRVCLAHIGQLPTP